MKVVQVIKSLGLGGAERLLVDAARAGPSLGIRHEVVSFLPHKTALIAELEEAGARVTILPASSSLGVLGQTANLTRYLRRQRPDCVHAHLPIAAVAARVACHEAGVPCVMTEHNVLERYHPLTRALTLSTWGLLSHVVACSQEVAASIERAVPPSSSSSRPVTVVQNGIDVDRFAGNAADRQRIRASLGVEPDDVLVGTVAVLRKQKALDRWLRVAREVARRLPHVRFVVVGDGPLRAELTALAAELGMQDLVRFVGLQREPLPWLAAMDVWLSTSAFEGLPLALLEALAAGRAVVATDVGGVSEVVVDGVNGRLLAPDDEAGLVDAVCAFSVDRVVARVVGERGCADVRARFGSAAMQQKLAAIYSSVA